ncbi:hypothetical protein EV385_2590 [Krasilnikovia cinnamomea]|uniref:Uncharacterized protein n=1 Tax=Krasilnikovia cinnamomea TaxID=349313 RepID=A0A4V2G715_9ACTN|nr:hypothetical protein [Krasilnikovia cinnamomea]RZU50806.1 hypothetical protein EV385_2590 [Krasilnikovia cinnamomea]
MLQPVRAPRKPFVRVFIAGVLDIAILVSFGAFATTIEDATGSGFLGTLSAFALCAPFLVWLAPKVSYRRRDAFLGPWLFVIIAWRIAYLPYRDWPPRDDEAPRAQYLHEAEFGTAWDPEYAGLWRLPKPSDVQVVSGA